MCALYLIWALFVIGVFVLIDAAKCAVLILTGRDRGVIDWSDAGLSALGGAVALALSAFIFWSF